MLKKSFTIFEGGLFGLGGGAVFGFAIGWLFDLIIVRSPYGFWFYWGVVLGALMGVISGLGVSILGEGMRYGLEWIFINGIAVHLGFFILNRDLMWRSWKFILIVTILGTIASWLAVLLIRKILSTRIPRRTFDYWIVVGYLIAFAVLTYLSPGLLQSAARAISP